MKKFCILPVIAALAFLASCEKPQSDEEKRAEVERQVQQRLAAEHQTEEQQRLAQHQADLEAREKALADKEARVSRATATPRAVATAAAVARVTRENSEPQSSSSYGTFYRKLEPYGAWRETTDYGYVFQPREARESRDWRPYTDGRWTYTDAGWTWVSEEPFGWATYHYGRWLRLRKVGWVWVPGEEWAPAWVSWRTSNQYVGWAPLPPEAHFDRSRGIHNWADNYYDIGPDQYAFVPSNELGSQRIQRAVVPVERNVAIVNETTNVTNITYNNTTIVNQGPNYEELRSRSAQPIERYRLERRAEMTSDTSRPVVRGEVIEMSAPIIRGERVMERPPTLGETLTQAVVDTGWAIADHSAAERARAKMKSEATPPPNAPPKKFVKPETVSTPAPTEATAAPAATIAATATVAPTATPTPTPRPTATATPLESTSPREIVTPPPTPNRAAQIEEQRRAAEEKRAAQQAQEAEAEQARAYKMMEESRQREAQKAARQQQLEEQRKARAPHAEATAAPDSPSAAAENPATPLPKRTQRKMPPALAPPPAALVTAPDGTPEPAEKTTPAPTPVTTPAETAAPKPAVAHDDRKEKNKKHKRPGRDDGAESEPTPAGSARPE